MAKGRRTSSSPPSRDARDLGLRAFRADRLGEAITHWAPLAAREPQMATALAEALFRRALRPLPGSDPLADLERAVKLVPKDARFQFHLGRLYHQRNDRPAAERCYRAALALDAGFAPATRLLALVLLEQNPASELDALPGLAPSARADLAPFEALLRGARELPAGNDNALNRFWRGLARVAAADAAALDDLSDSRPLPNAGLQAIRRYYRGVAAAISGDRELALRLWQQLYDTGRLTARLAENLATLTFERLNELRAQGDTAAATALAERSANLPSGVAFSELRLRALDEGAQAAAAAGNWARAATLWELARTILASSDAGLGSPRPLWQNLALAYEHQERWLEAAEAWRGMLRTRPRRRAAAPGDLSEPHWAWVRERIISCYKNAGRPDEAVVVFRQFIKADPDDLDTRVQLADALLANEQEQASSNEVERILAIDPQHTEALLRRASFLSARHMYQEAEAIARDLVARHPDQDKLRRFAATLFAGHATGYSRWFSFDQAEKAFAVAIEYDPENYHYLLNRARMLFNLKRIDEARPLLDRVLELAGNEFDTLIAVAETWVVAERLDELQALIERIEREKTPTAEHYIDLAVAVLSRSMPPPPRPFFLSSLPTPPPRGPEWRQFGLALLDKAVALNPNDSAILGDIASELMLNLPEQALTYAEQGVRVAPDSPEALLVLGMAQGVNNQTRAAKETLQRAAQLARRQGKRELAEQAQDVRRAVGTPMLRAALQAGLLQDEIDIGGMF